MPRAIRTLGAGPQIGRCGRLFVGRLHRQRHLLIVRRAVAKRGLLQLLLLYRERRRDAASPFAVEEGGILFVDMLLFFRGRVRSRDIETAVLHEIEIGVATAWLAGGRKIF